MKIIISNIIEIDEPTDAIKNYCKKELTVPNPEYNKKRQMGFFLGKCPRDLKLYDFDSNHIYLPIGCFNDIWNMYPDSSLYKDYSVKVPRKIQSNISLRDYQKPCLNALSTYVNGLFILPCGLGKTECALATAHYLQQHTLFITHTKDLMKQAKERCEEKMKCTTSIISDGKVDVSGDIVFATVQTLFKNLDAISQNEFGLVVVDECFPKGTKISTPNGFKNIEDIDIGDYVYSFNHETGKVEVKQVDYLFCKTSEQLCDITLDNGNTLTCTTNHPIYTNRGYIRADELEKGDIVYEMHTMWKGNDKIKFHERTMETQNRVLQQNEKNILFKGLFPQICNRQPKRLCSYSGSNKSYEVQQSIEERECPKEGFSETKRNRSQTYYSRRKWSRFNSSTRDIVERDKENISNSCGRTCNTNTYEKRFWLSNMLQNRHRIRNLKDRNRSRWLFTSKFRETRTRQEEDIVLREFRVEDIKISKPRSNGQFGRNYEGIKVYNIGVKDNHNYFANNILVHNCHHVAANADSVSMFRTSIDYFAARYKLGLTATLHRADGLEKCIPKLLGDIVYEIKEDKDDYVGIYEDKEVIRFPKDQFQVPAKVNVINTNYAIFDNVNNLYRDVFDRNGLTISFSKLISDIGNDIKRNQLIIDLCNNLKGSTIILSDRVDQLKYLQKFINNSVEIDGSTKKQDREQALEDIKSGKKRVLLASYKLAKEGLDCKILENVIFATPIKDEAIVIQCIGRAQRIYEGKKIANIYDLYDSVSMLEKFFAKRRAIYKKKNWL